MAFTTPQGRTATSLSEINVTPLVDVMLVLLIIFMVTAPMLNVGIDVELAKVKNVQADRNPEERIIISISGKGNIHNIYYGSEMINFFDIGKRLKREAKNRKDSIFLRADRDVKWQSIVSVIDEIRGAGFNKIELVTQPYKESEKH